MIATGVTYRKPDIPNLARFEGVGVYYGATPVEAILCQGEDVVVVGGANSAGQAAIFLSEAGRRVTMLIRGPGLSDTMSRYLIRRIEETPNIELKTRTRIVALEGANSLERVTWEDAAGKLTTVPIRHVFMMTGANPNTDWLQGCVALDEKGFVKAGPDLSPSDLAASRVAPAPPAPALRDEPARRLRRRRRARGKRQARGRRRGRRLRLHPARAQGAGGVICCRR